MKPLQERYFLAMEAVLPPVPQACLVAYFHRQLPLHIVIDAAKLYRHYMVASSGAEDERVPEIRAVELLVLSPTVRSLWENETEGRNYSRGNKLLSTMMQVLKSSTTCYVGNPLWCPAFPISLRLVCDFSKATVVTVVPPHG